MNGLYLSSPHGSLIHSGEKTSIATGKRYPITGQRLVCSQESGQGIAYGIAHIGDPAVLDITSFDSRVSSHQVTKSCRRKWWPDAPQLYDYPINSFQPFPTPIPVPISPGTTLDMGEISFPQLADAIKSIASNDDHIQSSEAYSGHAQPGTPLVIMSSSDKIESQEGDMPWKVFKQGDEYCVFKVDGSGDATGKTLGCHPDKPKADAQLRALYASESKAGDMGDGDSHTCTCPNCGTEVEAELRSPCREQECPKCGSRLRGGDENTESKDSGGEDTLDTASDEAQPMPTDDPATADFNGAISLLSTERLAELKGAFTDQLTELDDTHRPTVQATLDAVEAELTSRTQPDDDKAGRRINSSVLSKLRDIYDKLKEVLDFGDATDKKPEVIDQIASQVNKSYAFKTYSDGWFEIWPTNSYQDRDGEFFTSESIKNLVERHEAEEIKGETWFWHVPGSKFGTIYEQAVVEQHFLVQLGKFDNTPVGNAFKEFFSLYPDGHPEIAPWGWGASHGYAYIQSDREQDGTYNWFDIKESTVLPVHLAANVHNPRPFKEVFTMNDKQKKAFAEIGKLVGVPDLVEQITASAHLKKEELDGKIEHKSVDIEPEQVPDTEDKSLAPSLTPEVVAMIAEALTPAIQGPTEPGEEESKEKVEAELDVAEITKQIVGSLQLDNLSTAISTLVNEVKEVKERLDQVEQDDTAKVKAAVEAAPQFAWFQASQVEETVKSTPATSLAPNAVPDAVKAIAGRIEDAI